MKFHYCFIIILISVVLPVLSQEAETNLFKNEKRNERYNSGIPIISPVISPAYSPEMGFILTGGCLVSFKTKRNNDYLRHSFFSFLVNTDLKGGVEAGFNLNTGWFDDRLLFNLDADFINRPDHYWGIGFERAEEVEQGDNTTRYFIKYNEISPSLLIKTFDHFYAGIKADFKTTKARELSDLMMEDISILKDTGDLKSSGIGINMLYDARDIRTNPSKGFLINLEAIFYDNFLSGNYKYQLVGIDYRQYLPLFRKGSMVAWQLNSTLGFGNIPWCDLQKIGTPNDLRGFFKGQYRDKSTAVLQLEYRHTFSGNNKNGLSRHGFVFWIGCGTVFERITKIDNALFNTGLGYRFEIQPNNNLRIDLGFGTKNTGIYINYSESF